MAGLMGLVAAIALLAQLGHSLQTTISSSPPAELTVAVRACGALTCIETVGESPFALFFETRPQPVFGRREDHEAVGDVSWVAGRGAFGGLPVQVQLTITPEAVYGAVHTDTNGTFVLETRATLPDGTFRLSVESALLHQPEPHACVSRHAAPSKRRTSSDAPLRPRRAFEDRVCDIFLDADFDYFYRWGGEGTTDERIRRTTVRMVDTIYHANQILMENLEEQLSFHVIGTKVHTTRTFAAAGIDGGQRADRLFTNYQNFLRDDLNSNKPGAIRDNTYDALDVCLNMLFTHADLGGVLGVAIQGSTGINSGICSTNRLVYNIGLTNTMTRTQLAAPLWQSVLSTAHEIGHSLGSGHDCEISGGGSMRGLCSTLEGSDLCVPSAGQGGQFLMYPLVNSDVNPNSRFFSPCSKSVISDLLSRQGGCLHPPPVCAVNSGPCCAGLYLLPEGTLCSEVPVTQCMQPPMCDGATSSCPAPSPMPDGERCVLSDGSPGSCKSGACRHPHDEVCASAFGSSSVVGCTLANAPCVRSCRLQSESANSCRALRGPCSLPNGVNLTQALSAGTCLLSPTTMLCPRSAGLGRCSAPGVCVACSRADCTDVQATPIPDVARVCAYEPNLRGICSVPCGPSGERTVSYRCACSDGTIDTTGARCKDVPIPVGLEPCGSENVCVAEGAGDSYLLLEINAFAFSSSALEVFLSLELQRTLRIKQTLKLNEKQTLVTLAACRLDRGEGCLSGSTLFELLSGGAALAAADALGYTITPQKDNSLAKSGGAISTTIIIIICVVAGVVVLLALLYYVRSRQLTRRNAARKERWQQVTDFKHKQREELLKTKMESLNQLLLSGGTDIRILPPPPRPIVSLTKTLVVKGDRSRTGQPHVARQVFLGERDDELAFVPGDIIEVFLDVDTGIPGWSRGRLGKCVGLFPTDFVAATGAGVSLISTDRSDRPPSYHSSEMEHKAEPAPEAASAPAIEPEVTAAEQAALNNSAEMAAAATWGEQNDEVADRYVVHADQDGVMELEVPTPRHRTPPEGISPSPRRKGPVEDFSLSSEV